MDLDDIASTPAPETIPPPRARATSFGGNRCKVQFVGKDKATRLGKRFKLLDNSDLYRCENEPIGASSYWGNKRVCKQCHDLGRMITKKKQAQMQKARQAAANGMQQRTNNSTNSSSNSNSGDNKGGGGGGQGGQGQYIGQSNPPPSNGPNNQTGPPSNVRQSSDVRARQVTSEFITYFYSFFKDKVINIPNGHTMTQGVKELLTGLIPLVKKGRVKLGKDMMKFLQRKIEEIVRKNKSQTDLFGYVCRQTMEKLKSKERQRQSQNRNRLNSVGSVAGNNGQPQQQPQYNIDQETMQVNIDDIKMETVFSDILIEEDQYDDMILDIDEIEDKFVNNKQDIRSNEIHILSNNVIKQRMNDACSLARTTIKPSEDVEGYVQHVIDYILRDTLEGLIKLSKHRQESTKSASIAIGTNGTVQLGYDIHKYDAVFGPLPTHSIRVVKTNGHKRKRQRNEDASASNQLLRILKKQITEEKKSNKHNNDIDQIDKTYSIEENMKLLVKQQLRSSNGDIPNSYKNEIVNTERDNRPQTITTEDMKVFTSRGNMKSIVSANFIASLFTNTND